MNLVIVESPTKAKTIGKFLGKDYQVESSIGHIRDLPKSKLGIDIENNFAPQYVIPTKARKTVSQLKKAAAGSEKIILATDEDREGEAIAWHIAQILNVGEIKNQKSHLRQGFGGQAKIKNVERITFHEITEQAIEEALKNPRDIDINLVDAQQGRRILDRLVGYKLSPFLWKKIVKGLSAGRVQSVALKLIVERENEIRNFKPQEYWSIEALLQSRGLTQTDTQTNAEKSFSAYLIKIGNKTLEKFDIKTEEEAEKITEELKNCNFKISRIEKKQLSKNPPPPFITSTLQQEASKRLGFSAKKTMFIAQHLYENGLITYMRTDSLNLSKGSAATAKEWLDKNLGPQYAAQAPRFFKTNSRLAQEAHEAIRPTDAFNIPAQMKFENPDNKNLYQLIWDRFIASQMPQAIFDSTKIEIAAENSPNSSAEGGSAFGGNSYILNSTGTILRFDGFLKIWPQKIEERELPEISENELLQLADIKRNQHFTEPPARYSEATLVKTLEKHGIGRPSTYAPTIAVIQERNYVTKEDRRFHPTEIGELVNKVLTEHFPEIIDINFTAEMEENLDKIAEGKKEWQKVIGEFYGPFSKRLELKYQEVSKKEIAEEKTDIVCEKCGKPMIIKFGRFGKFLACSNFPDCKNAKPLRTQEEPKKTGIICPECGQTEKGELVERRVNRGRARGKIFWGCSNYPKCHYATWNNPMPQQVSGPESNPKFETTK